MSADAAIRAEVMEGTLGNLDGFYLFKDLAAKTATRDRQHRHRCDHQDLLDIRDRKAEGRGFDHGAKD